MGVLFPQPFQMKLSREGLSHAYSRAKSMGTQTWHTTKMVLNTTDKIARLAGAGLAQISDRLEPEVRDQASDALRSYNRRRGQIGAVMSNTERIGRAITDVGLEL